MISIINDFEGMRADIIKSSPMTPEERIQYIKSVWECREFITGMLESEDRNIRKYISKKMMMEFNNKVSVIIGEDFKKQVSKKVKNEVIRRNGGKCIICNFDVCEFLDAHHIIPAHLGGKNEIENLIPVCPMCHRALHHIERNGDLPCSAVSYFKNIGKYDKLKYFTEHLTYEY